MCVFYEVVDEEYIEFFIRDLFVNFEKLIMFVEELDNMQGWARSKKKTNRIKNQRKYIRNLQGVINEEIDMYEGLLRVREFTKALEISFLHKGEF